MSAWQLLLGIPVLLGLAGLARAAWSGNHRIRRYRETIQLFREAPARNSEAALEPLLRELEIDAAAWYLKGVVRLRAEQTREAARAFGIAHHADWRLPSAAILTFAALKADGRSACDIVEQVVTTWNEMDQPDLMTHEEERLLFDCIARTARPELALSLLGRLTWAVISPAGQADLVRLASERPTWSLPLFA